MKPKVAHLCSTYLRPSESFVYAYTQNLERYDPIVLCQITENLERFPGPEVFKIKDFNLVERILDRAGRDLMVDLPVTNRYFGQILTDQRPSLLHAHFASWGVYMLSLRKKLHLPLVTSVYGFDFSLERVNRLYDDVSFGIYHWRRAYKKLFQEGDLFLTYYHKGKRNLEAMGCPPEKAVVFPNGIDLNQFHFLPAERRDHIQILMVNRFAEKKGVEYAIRALRLLVEQHPQVSLKILGDGELFEEMKRLVNELDLQEYVKMPGFVGREEVLSEYHSSHLFLAPGFTASDGDDNGGGNVTVLEAMAAGVPVVGTPESSSEFVEDAVSGFLCREKDAEDLAEKILQVLDHPEVLPEMVAKARSLVEKDFDAQKQAHRLEELYDFLRKN